MKYVVVILDTEATPGLDDNVVPNIVGPYDTQAEAEIAARNLFRDLDRFVDFSSVRRYEIKPLRTYESTVDRIRSEVQMWARVDNRPFILDENLYPEVW